MRCSLYYEESYNYSRREEVHAYVQQENGGDVNQMGFTAGDLTEKPLVAIPSFVLCAFKANHPTITQKKADAIWAAVPKKSKVDVLTSSILGNLPINLTAQAVHNLCAVLS